MADLHNTFLLVEGAGKPIIAVPPKDITGAAQTGAWANMKFWKKCEIVIIQGAWAGGTPAVTLSQATSAAGAGAKALSFDRYYQFDQDTGEGLTYTAVVSDTFNLPNGTNVVTVIPIRAADLDINNNFAYFRANVASPGANADLLTVLYIFSDARYEGQAPNQPAVLT